jgi:plastocyanin
VTASRLLARAWLTVLAVAAPAAAYEAITVKDGGTVSGVVKFAGAPPTLSPIPVNKNRDVCGDQKPSEALVVGPNGGVRDAVIMIEGVARGKKATGDVIVDNRNCVFVGHVTAVAPGDRVRVRNQDSILHNTHGYLGHMFAWMLVHDSPYVAVTDATGAFRIGDVPPGTYKVTMWHAGFRPKGSDKDGRPLYDEPRTVTKELTIAPKGTATVEYELR